MVSLLVLSPFLAFLHPLFASTTRFGKPLGSKYLQKILDNRTFYDANVLPAHNKGKSQ